MVSAGTLSDRYIMLRSNSGDYKRACVPSHGGRTLSNSTRSSLDQNDPISYRASDINRAMRGNARDSEAAALLERYVVAQWYSLFRWDNRVLRGRSKGPITLSAKTPHALTNS